MSTALVVLVTVCYVGVSASEAANSNFPLSLVFGGYALANIGLLWAMR